ncbi:hypothetical protein K437DRAFT_136385 [Tilletiaria anomala UBC 951]|uniref:GAF domain-containing protein n=1 Tax=Tilletiaria anomala (strain ATCC 24038 / CBS 436.72 / UBC 951) TaxID=1037660 RepID=A0A066VW83_TILAU|nr:uncharacterized protein K437DRAFT_136385 [Tilletiaria anomala UBC 951]KDN44548.1 hypothetical protein K437DRAFT_136385 [Tilletiaria anomala UBC 951]
MARAASETRDQCPKPSTGGVLTRFRLRSAVSSQGLSTRAASSSGSGSASGAGSLVVSPCALAVRSEDLPLPHHHAAQAVGGLEVPLIYDVDSAERMHHSSPSLMGRQNGSERAHAMPLSPTMASPSPDSTGRSFFPDLIKGRRRKDTLRSHAPASAPAPTDYGLGSPSVSVGTCSRAGEFPPAPARQTSETSSAGGGCAAMAATSQAPVAATDPVVWHQRFANEVLEQEMREQEAIAQALMDHRLEKVKKSKDGAKDKEKGTRSFGLRHMFTKSGRNLKEEVRRGQLVDKGRQQEADRTSPPLPLSHSFDNSHATSMPPLPGPVEREDARISHDTRSVWSRPSAGNASFCSSSRASTAASLLSADQRSSAAGDTSADTSFSSADTSFSSADSISYKYSVSIPTESSAMSTSYPSGEMATRKGSINSRASIVTSSSSARSANGSGSGPSDAPASASTLASLTPLGSITSFKSSGSGGSDVPSLAPIGFRGSFGSNLLEEAFKAGMAEDRDSVVAQLRRRSRSGSSTSQQSSMSCKPPVIMRRTSSALNGAKLLDANLPPPIQEEARPQCDAPSSDATIIAHVQASVNSEVLQPPCKDKSQVGLSTPKASEINRSAQRGANPRSPTSPKQRALTGKLASQLAMLPSLSSSLGLCLQHTAAAATTVAVAPVIVAHTVDSTASLPPEEYWRAYANGQIELNDPVTPTFVSASQDGLRIHMAAMSPNLEAIQNATSPTDLSFPPPPLRASEGGRGFETPLLLSSCEAQRFQATLAAVKAVINVRETSRRLHSILERVCGAMRLEEVKVDAVLNTSVVCLARACAGASSMDGGDVFKTKACASTVTDAFAFVGLRSTSIAGHTVLCTDNASLVIRDIEADWRFRGLPVASSARFYAGIPIRDAQGHAIAVLSLWARTARPDGLTASQQKLLSLASREAAAELEASRRSALDLKLRELDQSVREWAYAVSHPTDSVDTASLATSKPPTAPISSPSPSLAERRNVKIPSELLLPSLRSIPESLHPEFIRLQKAVDAMSQALQVETVYLASVDSDPLNATAIASSKGSSRSVACLDAPLHLCALASTSQGLRWRGDRASQLIGTTGCNSSFTIRCETEEQARSKAFGRGWVLGLVAPTFDFEAPEVVMYIQRFARLLGIVLYEEESARTSSIATLTAGQPTKERSHHLHTSPMQQQQQRRKEAYLASSKDSALFLRSPIPKVQVDRPLPSHPGRTQVGTRVLPAASPPPASPLPLPPMTLPDPPVYVSSPSLSSREHGSNTHSPPKREVQLPPGHILNGISPPRSAAPVKQGALGTCQ